MSMNSMLHLSPKILHGLGRGELLMSDLSAEFLLHLVALCPECREAWEKWTAECQQEDLEVPPPPAWTEQLIQAAAGAAEEPKRRRQVKRQVRELLLVAEERRVEAIRRARNWYRSPQVAGAFLDLALERMPQEPAHAHHLATLAYTIAIRVPEAERAGLDVLAAAHQGNTLRAQGKLEEAESLLLHARFLAGRSRANPAVLAKLAYLEGKLRKDQGRLDEGHELLRRAISAFRLQRDFIYVAKCLLILADVHRAKAEPKQAVELVAEALPLIDPVAEPRLFTSARHNLALYLCDEGRLAEAQAVFEENQPLYARYNDRWTTLRVTWFAGRLARNLERFDEAQEKLEETVEGFAKAGIGYDAALASLDLAETFLAAGDDQKLQAMARGLQAVLRSEDLHREATAAVLLLQKALAEKIVSKNLLEHVRGYLLEARNNPALRFEPSS